VPGWVEWGAGWPRAQGRGGVSVQVWGWVCVVVISLVGEAVAGGGDGGCEVEGAGKEG